MWVSQQFHVTDDSKIKVIIVGVFYLKYFYFLFIYLIYNFFNHLFTR